MTKRRLRRLALLVLVVAVIVVGVVRVTSERAVASTLFGETVPTNPAFNDSKPVTVGVRFLVVVDGVLSAVRFYQGAGNRGPHLGGVYDENGRQVATTATVDDASVGWRSLGLDRPLGVKAGTVLTAAVQMPFGRYAVDSNFAWPRQSPGLTGQAGTYAYSSTLTFPTSGFRNANYWVDVDFSAPGLPTSSSAVSASPTSPPTIRSTQAQPEREPPTSANPGAGCVGAKNVPGGPDPWGGCWPGPQNTGYPHGLNGDQRTAVTLTPYTGPSRITTCGTVIDSKVVSNYLLLEAGNDSHDPTKPCLTIKNSLIKGVVHSDNPKYGPIVIADSEIDLDGDVGFWENIGRYNVFAYRVNSHGGEAVIRCADYCKVKDSWVHGPFLNGSYHYNAFGSNGIEPADGYFSIEHNWASCGDWTGIGDDVTDAANCSSDIGFYGDFAPIHDVTIEKTFLRGVEHDPATLRGSRQPAYCLNPGYYPGKPFPTPTKMVVTDNVFGRGTTKKCGVYGATNSLGPAGSPSGNVWARNTYTDGGVVDAVEE